MSKALTTTGGSEPNNVRGVIAGVGSVILPGVGQLINGETNKGIGVGVTYLGAGAIAAIGIPLIAPVAGAVACLTWIYGVADGFLQGRKK